MQQLLYIANASSLQEPLRVDVQVLRVLLSSSPWIGFSIIQLFSFVDGVEVSRNDENDKFFALYPLVQSVQRRMFIQNYIDETVKNVKSLALFQNGVFDPQDGLAALAHIQFGDGLEEIVARARSVL